jgi:hypothetical protein
MYGDCSSVMQNATIPEVPLKKKTIALCYHFVRENVSNGTIDPIKLGSKDNYADLLTKPLDRTTSVSHVNNMLLTCPLQQ